MNDFDKYSLEELGRMRLAARLRLQDKNNPKYTDFLREFNLLTIEINCRLDKIRG